MSSSSNNLVQALSLNIFESRRVLPASVIESLIQQAHILHDALDEGTSWFPLDGVTKPAFAAEEAVQLLWPTVSEHLRVHGKSPEDIMGAEIWLQIRPPEDSIHFVSRFLCEYVNVFR